MSNTLGRSLSHLEFWQPTERKTSLAPSQDETLVWWKNSSKEKLCSANCTSQRHCGESCPTALILTLVLLVGGLWRQRKFIKVLLPISWKEPVTLLPLLSSNWLILGWKKNWWAQMWPLFFFNITYLLILYFSDSFVFTLSSFVKCIVGLCCVSTEQEKKKHFLGEKYEWGRIKDLLFFLLSKVASFSTPHRSKERKEIWISPLKN